MDKGTTETILKLLVKGVNQMDSRIYMVLILSLVNTFFLVILALLK